MLEEMFADIRSKTPWDISGPMLWGYFFTGSNEDEIDKVAIELTEHGYEFVEIRELESDEQQAEPEWQLHVERIEVQTVDALYARNGQLEALAARFDNVVYDGMDVGPTDTGRNRQS
jgi:regulator of RNase E activity RraB